MQHDGQQLSKATGHISHFWSPNEKIISQFSAGAKSVHVLDNEIPSFFIVKECALIAFWGENKEAGKEKANISYTK